jgi:hypothetical protein
VGAEGWRGRGAEEGWRGRGTEGQGHGQRDSGTEGWRDRDRGTEGQRDRGTEGWRDGGMEGQRNRGSREPQNKIGVSIEAVDIRDVYTTCLSVGGGLLVRVVDSMGGLSATHIEYEVEVLGDEAGVARSDHVVACILYTVEEGARIPGYQDTVTCTVDRLTSCPMHKAYSIQHTAVNLFDKARLHYLS